MAQPEYFVAEGVLVIRHLLRSPYPLRSMLMTALAWRALEGELPDVEVAVATEGFMREIAGFNFHRGALASAGRRPLPASEDLLAPARLVLAVEGVNDHENLGGLFRNAAAFGVDAVLLDTTTCDPLYRRAVRVSMGHVLRIPFTRAPDLGVLRAAGFDVAALTPSGDVEIGALQRQPRQAVLVGAEGPGLSAQALAAADHRVRIAMAPAVDSINVATAAAIALHRLCA